MRTFNHNEYADLVRHRMGDDDKPLSGGVVVGVVGGVMVGVVVVMVSNEISCRFIRVVL